MHSEELYHFSKIQLLGGKIPLASLNETAPISISKENGGKTIIFAARTRSLWI